MIKVLIGFAVGLFIFLVGFHLGHENMRDIAIEIVKESIK